ncbi:MAG: sulfatase [Tannerella sp.]|nr:sulfatase [Tannerella sp.]
MKYKTLLTLATLAPTAAMTAQTDKPNILLIVCEDISPYLHCYGDPVAVSPNIDRLAEKGIRHTNMFTCIGVSAPSRYSLITGRYSSEDGANYMRVTTFDNTFETVPPEGVKCYTEYLREAGYYCTNNSKTDYQFTPPIAAWDENGNRAHWKNAPDDQPFFAIFNINTTHESQLWERINNTLEVDPQKVPLPPYYPDVPEVRHGMAVMYSNIAQMDREVKAFLDELASSPRSKNTIVIFQSDNGGPIPRGKREIMDSGSKVPFIIAFPDGRHAGTVNNELNMFVDIPATILSLAGIKIPSYMHGQAMYGQQKSASPRQYVFGATDRFDEQVEKRASIRDDRFLYIRNYMPQQSVYRPNQYRLQIPMMKKMEEMRDQGALDPVQMLWFAVPTPAEALYDCQADPYQIHNLAADPQYASKLDLMRQAFQQEWIDKYNPNWVAKGETFFIGRARPGGEQPVTATPEAEITPDGYFVIKNSSPAATVSYAVGDQKMKIYTQPVKLQKGDEVTFLAGRIGYKNSEKRTLLNVR